MISNARMYAVTPEIEAHWQALLGHVAAESGVALDYTLYPAPLPLEDLWKRNDLGCVLMCGYPIALHLANVTPIAAPVPSAPWTQGRAVYRSDLIVRADSRFHSLEETFGARLGWTVEHSHSGFNALRHHLLRYRTPQRPKLYGTVIGPLVTARRILDELLAGSIDVGPLDAYWHALIAHARPDLTAGIRVLESTDLAPMPAFVASAAMPAAQIEALCRAFTAATTRPWFAPIGKALMLTGFQPVTHQDFEVTLAWDRAAKDCGYFLPA